MGPRFSVVTRVRKWIKIVGKAPRQRYRYRSTGAGEQESAGIRLQPLNISIYHGRLHVDWEVYLDSILPVETECFCSGVFLLTQLRLYCQANSTE